MQVIIFNTVMLSFFLLRKCSVTGTRRCPLR